MLKRTLFTAVFFQTLATTAMAKDLCINDDFDGHTTRYERQEALGESPTVLANWKQADKLLWYLPEAEKKEWAKKKFLFLNIPYKGASQCFKRAHTWSYAMWKKRHLLSSVERVYSKKAVIFYTSKFYKATDTKGNWWRYHVAPAVHVHNHDDENLAVLDKGFYKRQAPSLRQWLKMLVGKRLRKFRRGEGKHCNNISKREKSQYFDESCKLAAMFEKKHKAMGPNAFHCKKIDSIKDYQRLSGKGSWNVALNGGEISTQEEMSEEHACYYAITPMYFFHPETDIMKSERGNPKKYWASRDLVRMKETFNTKSEVFKFFFFDEIEQRKSCETMNKINRRNNRRNRR